MSDGLIPFGVRCRQHRSRLGLVMGDQARGLRYSVSAISAIERGARPIPPNYPEEVGTWLKLSQLEIEELTLLASGQRTVVHVLPADNERAQLAFDFARALNELPIDEVRQLRKRLTSSKSPSHNVQDLRRMAALVHECFALGNKLAFDLLDILENKLALIDPDYSLHVKEAHLIGDRVAAYSQSIGDIAKNVVFSSHSYDQLSKQTAEVRFVGAHELAHWLVHPKSHAFANARRTTYQPIEIEADLLARLILLPESVVRTFETVGQLAMVCNVPVRIAQIRMKELGLGPFREQRKRVRSKLLELSDQLKKADKAVDSGKVIAFRQEVASPTFEAETFTETSREPLDAKNMLVALGRFSGRYQPPYETAPGSQQTTTTRLSIRADGNPADAWFRNYGWRA